MNRFIRKISSTNYHFSNCRFNFVVHNDHVELSGPDMVTSTKGMELNESGA